MDMHSYAKIRGVTKWTHEHKRKLLESRIAYNSIFDGRYNIEESWKKVISDANLDEFNPNFIRRQWSCLLTKYRNLITRHCGHDELDVETMKMLELEWEFFKPLHQYVSQIQNTWNVHSYALSPYAEDDIPLPKSNSDFKHYHSRLEKSKKRVDFKRKYYKHCVRHNRRMEKKFDALLCVFGQMVQASYPDVDLSKMEDCFNDVSDTDDEDLMYELDCDD